MANGVAKFQSSPSVELRARAAASVTRHRFLFAALGFLAADIASLPAQAQQSNPGYDPRQTEKRFETPQQSDSNPAARPRIPGAPFVRPEGGDTKPLSVLHHVSVAGAI